jgi:hypothetical protein
MLSGDYQKVFTHNEIKVRNVFIANENITLDLFVN